jgi:nucleoside-diphosphate-sugar epimerase
MSFPPADGGRSKVLVTGGSGYLGQHLLTPLAHQFDVVVTYNTLPSFAAEWSARGIRCVALDLTRAGDISSLVAAERPDAVVHLAAISSPAVFDQNPERSLAITR